MTQEAHMTTVQINILDKEYGVACSPEEETELRDSARLLDERMREIRLSGKIVGTERIAVMAALNIAHELVKAQTALKQNEQVTEKHLSRINAKIEQALADARQMDL
ncbi:MAG: cell division protein ZapA [Gammaproteobacteria bacterium]|nr:MAG: cell division protein ZapA [Gammaproteobacteria bacterium]